MLAGVIVADEARAMFDMPVLPNQEGKKLYVPIKHGASRSVALEQVKAAEAAAKSQLQSQQQLPPPGDDSQF